MDLKSGGFIKILVILEILAISSTEVILDETDTDPIFLDTELDYLDDSPTTNTADKEVYVVAANGNLAYVEFVKDVLNAGFRPYGYIHVKMEGKEVQRLEEKNGLTGLNLAQSGNGPTETVFEQTVAALVFDGMNTTAVVLAESGTPGDQQGLDSLFAHICSKNAMINVLTMEQNQQGMRIKRATTGINIYQQIAQASGGSVIQTTKNNIGSVVNLLKQTLKTNPVDIMRFDFPNKPGSKFNIPVDDTMTQLTIQVQTPVSLPIVMITTALGIPADLRKAAKPLGTKLEIYEFNMTKPTDYGQWKFTKLVPGDWDITVRGQSPVDFTHAFMEPGPGGIGSYPIKGRPISGKTYQLSITVPQIDKIKSVFAAMLLDNNNMPAVMATLKNIGGRRGKTRFTANVTIPKFDFKVAIDGMDKTNHQVRRLDPILISPISIRLSVQSLAGVKLYINETVDIPFTVTNEANQEQQVLFKIEDDKNFALSPVFLLYKLKAGENVTRHFKIKGGPVAGVTTTFTITARPYVKHQVTKGQFEIRRLTVEDRHKKKNDTINPTCNVTSVVGTCNIGSDLCACVNHTWSMEVLIGDEGFGLQDIFPVGAGSNNTFQHDAFTVGRTIDKGATKASITGADCCHQMASIQVVDKAGNLAQCTPNITQNFTAPDPKVCNHTNVNQTIGCMTMTQTGTCNFGTNPCDCHTKSWHLKVEFNKTNNIDLLQAFSIGAGNNGSLKRTGQVVELDLDCCQQEITIVGQDIAGNIGECNVTLTNYKGPKPSTCTSSTSTTTSSTTITTSVSTVKSTSKTSQTPKTVSTASSKVASAGGTTASSGSGATSKSGSSGTGSSGNTKPNATPGGTKTSGTSKPGVTNTAGVTQTPGGHSGASASNAQASTKQPTGKPNPGNTATQTQKPGNTVATQKPKPGNTNTVSHTKPKPGNPGPPTTTGSTSSANSAVATENKSGVPESAVAAGMSVAAIGALSAVVIMAVLTKRALNKAAKSVDPYGGSKRDYDDRRGSAWS